MSTACSMAICAALLWMTGCARTRVVVIPSDQAVIRYQPMTIPPSSRWFVPDARMQDILEAISTNIVTR